MRGAWGLANQHYFMDHRQKLMAACNLRKGLARGLVPNHARWRRTSGEEAGDFNLDDLAPYVQGANDGPWNNATYVGEMWYCPSSEDGFWQNNIADQQAKNVEPNHPLNDHFSFMYMDYAYFGLVASKYRAQTTRPQRLSNRSMGEGRVLMSDTIFLLAGSTQWTFNHSDDGFSMHEPGFGEKTWRGVPPQLTANQLYADGSVKRKDDFIEESMNHPPDPLDNDWVSSNTGAERDRYAIINFY